MCRHILLAVPVLLAVALAAPAQTTTDEIDQARRDAAQAQQELTRLEQQTDKDVYSYRKSKDELNTAVDRFNGQVRTVRNEGQFLDLKTQIANNLISLRKKDQFDKALDKMRQDSGVNEEFGYRRIREVNGFDGSSYSRYYDKDGNLIISQVRDYRDGLQREREDWAKARQRAVDASDKIERQYQDLVKKYGSVSAALSTVAGQRAEAQRRLDQFQSLERQRVMEEERRRQQEEAERLRNQRRRGPID